MSGVARTRTVFLTALTSIFVRGFSALVNIVTVPMMLSHLGRERFGVWSATLAIAAFFTLADGGVTNGLIQKVANAHGASNRVRIRALIASALATTALFVLAFLIGAVIIAAVTDWRWVFNVSDQGIADEAKFAVIALCVGYAFSFPPTVVRQARMGLMEGAQVNLWDMAGNFLSLASILLAVHFNLGLVGIAVAWSFPPALVRAAAALVYLAGKGRDIIPRWSDVTTREMRALVVGGSAFMGYSIAQILVMQSDQIMIARLLGPDAVADYAVVQRIFIQIQVVASLVLAAQLGAYGEALTRSDDVWIKRQLLWTLGGTALISSVGSGLIALFITPILQLWIGGQIEPNPLLVDAMAAYIVITSIANVFTYFFLALGQFQRVMIPLAAMIFINIPLSLFLIGKVGNAGAIIATSCSYVITMLIPGAFAARAVLNRLPAVREKVMTASKAAAGQVGAA